MERSKNFYASNLMFVMALVKIGKHGGSLSYPFSGKQEPDSNSFSLWRGN